MDQATGTDSVRFVIYRVPHVLIPYIYIKIINGEDRVHEIGLQKLESVDVFLFCQAVSSREAGGFDINSAYQMKEKLV
jgi:hypothetical protein